MSTPWILLDSSVCFRFSGKDARRYLHNRLTQDIRGLGVGDTTFAAALTAQGRVEGVFTVLCRAEDTFLLTSDGGDLHTLEGALKRFVVADRVVCEDLSRSVSLVHIAADQAHIEESLRRCGINASGRRRHLRVSSSGVDCVVCDVEREDLAQRLQGVLGEQLTRAQYDYARWERCCPVFPEEINDQGMLLEFNLRDAVSFSKGCYVGQEVVERSDAIGRVPRCLERIVLVGAAGVEQGSAITTTDGSTLGKVVRGVTLPGRDEVYLFALLSAGKYKEGYEVRCAERRGCIVANEAGTREAGATW